MACNHPMGGRLSTRALDVRQATVVRHLCVKANRAMLVAANIGQTFA